MSSDANPEMPSALAAFFGGLRASFLSVFVFVLVGTYVGIAALAQDYGFSLAWVMASTVLVWAGPSQVIMISALDDVASVVRCIEAGADDYLTKPFQMEELIARIRAVLRRTHGHAGPLLKAGKLTLDTNQMRINLDGKALALTPLEYRLVSYLLHHKGRVVPGAELLEHVYGNEDAREVNAIEALIVRLRRKLGAETIETRRGQGYLVKDGGD